MPDTQIYDLDGLPRTSIPRRRRALVGIGVLETLSLVVLLGDLASGNERLIAQAVGPLHGPMYLTGIVLIFTTERSPQPTACRDPKYRKFFSPSRRRTPRPTPADVNNRPAQPNAGALAANDTKTGVHRRDHFLRLRRAPLLEVDRGAWLRTHAGTSPCIARRQHPAFRSALIDRMRNLRSRDRDLVLRRRPIRAGLIHCPIQPAHAPFGATPPATVPQTR